MGAFGAREDMVMIRLLFIAMLLAVLPANAAFIFIDSTTGAESSYTATGADGSFVSGTAGSDGHCAQWNADGDLVTTGASCGDVSGPETSTDNTIPIWDGTDGSLLKDGTIAVDPSTSQITLPSDDGDFFLNIDAKDGVVKADLIVDSSANEIWKPILNARVQVNHQSVSDTSVRAVNSRVDLLNTMIGDWTGGFDWVSPIWSELYNAANVSGEWVAGAYFYSSSTAGSLKKLVGNNGAIYLGSSASANEVTGIRSDLFQYSSGTITDLNGIIIEPWINKNVVNFYGLKLLDNQSGATATGDYFGVYSEDESADNYFAGDLGAGVKYPANPFEVLGKSVFFSDYTDVSNNSSFYIDYDSGNALYILGAEKLGTGTERPFSVGDSDDEVSFFEETPISRYSTTGTTTGFTQNSGTQVRDDSTFTGNVGTTAYTLGDIVRALKLYGLLTQ
jgi:hypothetical protein